MKMKQLSLAVLMATTFTLVGCEDADNAKQAETTQATQAEPAKVVAPVEEKKEAFDLAKVADNAQARYEAQSQLHKALYGAMFSHLQSLVQFDFSNSDYARQDNGATAKSKLSVKILGEAADMPKDLEVEVVGNDTISYSEALWNEGVEARVESKLSFADSLVKAFDVNPAEDKEVVDVFQKIEAASSARYDLLKDKNVHSQFEIGEVKVTENGNTIDFKGFKGEGKYNEDSVLALLGAGDYHYEFAGLTLSEIDKIIAELKPLSLDYSLKTDGTLTLKGSALEAEFPVDGNAFKVNSIVGEGKITTYDSLIAGYLGSTSLSFKDIEIKAPEFAGQSHNFGSAHFSSNSSLNDGLYNISGKFLFEINDKTLKALAPEAPANVEFKHVSLGFDGTRLSVELMKKFQEISQNSGEFNPNDEQSVQLLADVLDDVVKQRAVFKITAQLDTSAGQVNADLNLQAAEGASFDKAAFVEQVKAGTVDEKQLSNLFVMDALVTGDAKLMDDTGASMMLMMMAGEFVEQKDGQYRAHVAFKDGVMTVNGKEVPMN